MALSQEDFELLLQANRILSSKLDVNEVLQAVMELATKVVKAEASSLLLLDEKTNELYFDVALGTASASVKQVRLKVGEGIAGWVAKERQPLIINDVTKDYRFTGKVDKATSFKTRSILAVPLLAKGRLIGVVEAINKELNQSFSSSDQEAFEVFAGQAAVAIENARLFTAVISEKEKLVTVFSKMSDGVMLLDKTGVVIIVNDTCARFLGFTADEMIGKKFGPTLFPDFEKVPSLSDLKSAQFDLVRRKGKDFFLSMVVNPVQEGFLLVLSDTTESKREDRLKQNFLSLISHKLKTPLTVILGYAPALEAGSENLSAFQKKGIKAICQQGEQLVSLVDKLLHFTLVESDNLKPKVEPRKMWPLVKEAADVFQPPIQIDRSIETLPDVFVDGNLMINVLKNIFENAYKFNDKETKSIDVKGKKSGKKVELSISDNGVGIPPEEMDKIFQKFYQIENSFTGQIPGAGLGLALCKRAVEAMGGSIAVESQLGQGSTFKIVLPCK